MPMMMIHPAECNRMERMNRSGNATKHTPRGAHSLGPAVLSSITREAQSNSIELSPFGFRPDENFIRVGSTAVVLVEGPIWFDHSGYGYWGGMSTIQLANTLLDIASDDTITDCVLDMDSPGGTVAGIDDLITAMMTLKAAKPVVSFVHEMAASLAYWLASCTDRIYGTPSSISGAIGAIAVWYDTAGAAAEYGEKPIVFTSGTPLKAMGHWGVPISEEMAENEQAIISAMGAMFRSNVAEHRSLSEEQLLAMKGATYFGQSQVDQGLVDELISTNELYSRVLEGTLIASRASGEPNQSEPAARAARPGHIASTRTHTQRTSSMDDTTKEQIEALTAEMTDEEKQEVIGMLGDGKDPDKDATATTGEETSTTDSTTDSTTASTEVKDDEEQAMTITAAKALLSGLDLDENTVNKLAITALEKNLNETAVLKLAIVAQKNIDPEIAQLAQGNDAPIGGNRGGGNRGGNSGDAIAKYHAKVKETMETFQLSKPAATAKVNSDHPEMNTAYIAQFNKNRSA